VIAVHSLEDRIVKRFIQRESGATRCTRASRRARARAALPRLSAWVARSSGRGRGRANPRARSAVLRMPRGWPHDTLPGAWSWRCCGWRCRSSLGVLYAKHEARSSFNELQKLTKARDDLDIDGSCSSNRDLGPRMAAVERVGRDELRMVIRQASDLRIVSMSTDPSQQRSRQPRVRHWFVLGLLAPRGGALVARAV